MTHIFYIFVIIFIMTEFVHLVKKIADLSSSDIDSICTVNGWVTKSHMPKKVTFVWLADNVEARLKHLQVVFDSKTLENFADTKQISKGWSLQITGKIVKSLGSQQEIEMYALSYKVYGKVKDSSKYELAQEAYPIEYYRDIPYIECLSLIKSSVYAVRSCLMDALNEHFKLHKIKKVDMPLITYSQCEGGANPAQCTDFLKTKKITEIPLITVKKNDSESMTTNDIDFSRDFASCATYLTESAQMHLETQLYLGDVWTETRAVRFEPSMSSRHLACFSMIEAEFGFIEKSYVLMDFIEEQIKWCVQYVRNR